MRPKQKMLAHSLGCVGQTDMERIHQLERIKMLVQNIFNSVLYSTQVSFTSFQCGNTGTAGRIQIKKQKKGHKRPCDNHR